MILGMAVFRFRIFTRQISSKSYNHSQSDCLCNVAHRNLPSVSRHFALHDNESDLCWDCLGLAYETNLTLLTSHHTLPHHTLPTPSRITPYLHPPASHLTYTPSCITPSCITPYLYHSLCYTSLLPYTTEHNQALARQRHSQFQCYRR